MSGKTRLAIVGASARAAAQSAVQAGFDVVAADLFADEDLRQLCPATRIPQEDYPDLLADWLAKQDVDAWRYTGALENHPEFVDRMAEIAPLWGNRGDTLRRVRDPFRLASVIDRTGFAFPETRRDPAGLPRDGSWLVKPLHSAGGYGVRPLMDAGRSSSPCVYQQRVEGVPASLLFFCHPDRAEPVGAATQIVGCDEFGATGFAFCGGYRNESLFSSHKKSIQALGVVLISEFGLRDYVGVDLVVGVNKTWVIEINPRYTASAELFSEQGPPLSGKAILYARSPVVVSEELNHWVMTEASRRRLADIPASGVAIEKGQPVLTILEPGPAEGVLDRLKNRAAEIESRLYA